MCKIVKDIQQVLVVPGDKDDKGNARILELEAKGYQMFYAPVMHEPTHQLIYTLTLIEEHTVESYEKIVKETIKGLEA